MIKVFLHCFLAFCLAAQVGLADSLTKEQSAALNERLDVMEANYWDSNSDADASLGSPKTRLVLARALNLEVAEFNAFAAQQRKKAIGATTLISLLIDRDAAYLAQTGTGRAFAVIPASRVLDMNGQKFPLNFNVLAFEDDGVWFLMHISFATSGLVNPLNILKKAYPDFSDVPNAVFFHRDPEEKT